MSRFQIVSIFMFTFLAFCLAALWYFELQSLNNLKQDIAAIRYQTPTLAPSNPSASNSAQFSAVQSSLDSLTRRVDDLENIPATTPATAKKSPSAPFQKQVLTLGSANTNSLTWAPTGLEITINSADYPSIVMAYFEAGLNCAGGIASARLTNKTTGAIINLSEVSHDTNTVTYKRSTGFKLHPGNNNYVVELRSSSGEAVYLSSSRLILEKP